MKTKTCTKCHSDLPISDFYKQSDRQCGYSSCKACFNRYCMDRWIERKKEAIASHGGQCTLCGYKKCIEALEFHHTDPSTKEFEWGRLKMRSKACITEELNKCVLVCANCHREIHKALIA